ncbi:MAG: phenylalanine--tRNA ligase subunit alpha, partial [Planctomycetota bacterium]
MLDRHREWLEAIVTAADESALAQVESRLLGKKGELQDLLRSVSQLDKSERPAAGKALNELK